MLASTVQFSSYERPPPTTRRLPTTPPHTTAHKHHSTEHGTVGGSPRDGAEETRPNGPIPQDPTACQATHPHPPARSHPAPPTHQRGGKRTSCTRTGRSGRRQLTDVPPSSTLPGTRAPGRALAPPTGPHPQRAGTRAGREDAP